MIYHVSMQKKGSTDPAVTGEAPMLPTIGAGFILYPYDGDGVIVTSRVQAVVPIEEDQRLVMVIFRTKNSSYELKISHTEGT